MIPEYYQSQRFERQIMDLITTDEYQVKSCQTGGFDNFSHDNIIVCEKEVRSIQERLDKAVANGDKTKIRWYIHLLSKKSKAVKTLAIHRICQVNQGRYTAGVDGMTVPKDKVERHAMMETLLNSVDITSKPKPIRRVFIPKSNGEYRPLSIPTINDRIIQEIVRQAIEPICEHHFLPCNHGFRPRRSCHDAIADLFSKLSRKGASRWVVEGDIKGCFDNISHEHIISTLHEWNVPNTLTAKQLTQIVLDAIDANVLSPEDVQQIARDAVVSADGISPQDIAQIALKSTVYLRAKTQKKNYYGSGFVVGEGLIATCEHVIKGMTSGTVESVLNDTKYPITAVLAVSKKYDIAIVEAQGFIAPPLPLGDSDTVRVGDVIYAAGNPEKYLGTFSVGIIGAIRSHSLLIADKAFHITAPVSHGSSGGTVLNSEAKVVGVVSSGNFDGQNLNFAVPVNFLKLLLATIR